MTLFLLGGTSVASLLAWVMGLAGFHTTFRLVSVPGQAALLVVAMYAARTSPRLRRLLIAGVIGGLVGTLAYDVVRIPFVMAGYRVLAPIDSYGVLAAGASTSSPWTGLLGWSYHFANGIGFGIAYAMLAPRARWQWGIAWGLLLETVTIVTPFATTYGLIGGPAGTKWIPISIAYAAHVPYGALLGLAVARRDRLVALIGPTARVVPATLVVLLLAVVQWQAPWRSGPATRGADVADGASAVVIDGEFHPEWLRVAVGGCVEFDNLDATAWTIAEAGASATLVPGRSQVCFTDDGVHRVRTSDEPFAGGFVIVDPYA